MTKAEPMTMLSVRLPASLVRRVDRIALDSFERRSEVVRKALESAVAKATEEE